MTVLPCFGLDIFPRLLLSHVLYYLYLLGFLWRVFQIYKYTESKCIDTSGMLISDWQR